MTLENLEHLLKAISAQGFSLPQIRLLLLLKDGKLSMSEIAKSMGYSTAASTGGVDQAHRKGLVERTHATDDRRNIHVSLTETGKSELSKVDKLAKTFSVN